MARRFGAKKWAFTAACVLTACSDGGDGENISARPDGGSSDAQVSSAVPDAGAELDAGPNADGGGAVDAGSDGGSLASFGFTPSNLSSSQLTPPPALDLRIATPCTFTSNETGSLSCSGGGNHTGEFSYSALDGSEGVRLGVLRVRSLQVDMAGSLTVRGPLPLVIVANNGIRVFGRISAAAQKASAYGGGFPVSTSRGPGQGPGAGQLGVMGQFLPSSGAGHCGRGGRGAAPSGATGVEGGASYGQASLIPLLGGSSGGGGGEAGAGGGALQLVSALEIVIGSTGVIDAGGGGARNQSSGGGAGGALLLEAPSVSLQGTLAANGGAGSAAVGGAGGQDALASAVAAQGELGTLGGQGSAGDGPNGGDGMFMTSNNALGGGGGAGRIRINSTSGAAALTGTLSPSLASSCATQGALLPLR